MTEDRNERDEQAPREPQDGRPAGTPGRVEEGGASDAPVGTEQESAAGSSERLETRLPLEPGEGPRAPQGDALLDGSGSRHGVDSREERPGGR